jgi:two-component system OmpR family sensor kinase
MTIRLRLTLAYTAILAVTLFLFGLALYLLLENRLLSEVDNQLQVRGQEVVRQIQVIEGFPFGFGKLVEIPSFDIFAAPDLFIQVLDVYGEVQARSDNLSDQVLPITSETLDLVREGNRFLETYTVNGHPIRVYYLPFSYKDSLIGIIQVATPLSGIESSLGTLRRVLLVVGLLIIAAAAGVGWLLAREALKPVDRIISATEQIQEGKDLGKRIRIKYPNDEIGRLSETINLMLSRLQAAYNQMEKSIKIQRRFVSDASHELRSPLTTIRGNAEWLIKTDQESAPEKTKEEMKKQLGLYREAWYDIFDETKRMSSMVDDLLVLARSDAQAPIPKGEVPIRDWLEEIARKAAHVDRGPGFKTWIDIEKPEDPLLLGNRELLDRMVWVLLDNAFKYTSEGEVRLEAGLSPDKARLILRVSDTGIGIAARDLPYVFDRFYRADQARDRSGTGLGLSIAQSIATEHGGTITVESEVGKGTQFTISLPTHFVAP